MQLLSPTATKGALACFASVSLVGATAWLTLDWDGDLEPSPAAVVSLRFPQESTPLPAPPSTPDVPAPPVPEPQPAGAPMFTPAPVARPWWQAAGQLPEQATEYAD